MELLADRAVCSFSVSLASDKPHPLVSLHQYRFCGLFKDKISVVAEVASGSRGEVPLG